MSLVGTDNNRPPCWCYPGSRDLGMIGSKTTSRHKKYACTCAYLVCSNHAPWVRGRLCNPCSCVHCTVLLLLQIQPVQSVQFERWKKCCEAGPIVVTSEEPRARHVLVWSISSTVLDRIPWELPLHGVDSFSEDTFVKSQRKPSLGHDPEFLIG